ncbi:MAG: hypothetical protein AAGI38_12795 [Bacteroidota bacterium]
MSKKPFFTYLLWTLPGVVLLLVSGLLAFYDAGQSDEVLKGRAQRTLQQDLNRCVQASINKKPGRKIPGYCKACDLTYSESGKLISWENSQFLPAYERINLLKLIPQEEIVYYGNRVYLQLRQAQQGQTRVVFIPIYFDYGIENEYLLPHVFLGTLRSQFTDDEVRRIRVSTERMPEEVNLNTPTNVHLLSLRDVEIKKLRQSLRWWVVGIGSLGLVILLLGFRIASIKTISKRFWADMAFLPLLPLIRVLLWLTNLPGNYVDNELFSPNILAINFLAPSLGDLSLNIFVLTFSVWLLYKNLYVPLQNSYQKLVNRKVIAWGICLLNLAVCSLLLWAYNGIFDEIMLNSQVDVEFSNVFETSIYSFIILLDIGMLLMAIAFVIIGRQLVQLFRHNWYPPEF